ncbi:MAG TPA: HEAT repeat domain-containing protein [Aggregatilineales bacterium]|nr:HEAT repeat domain-containing protein [Aggregatilineales bacterium]
MEPEPKLIRQLLGDLRSFDKERRRAAVMKLGMIGGDDALRALIMTVRNDYEDLITRGRAALMLGQLKDYRAVDTLIQALDAPGFLTPVHAAEALGKIGDPRAVQPLLSVAMNTGNESLRKAAENALESLGAKQPCPEPDAVSS